MEERGPLWQAVAQVYYRVRSRQAGTVTATSTGTATTRTGGRSG
jgi:hypothetical protein